MIKDQPESLVSKKPAVAIDGWSKDTFTLDRKLKTWLNWSSTDNSSQTLNRSMKVLILNSQVLSLPLQGDIKVKVTNFCAVINTLVDQDGKAWVAEGFEGSNWSEMKCLG